MDSRGMQSGPFWKNSLSCWTLYPSLGRVGKRKLGLFNVRGLLDVIILGQNVQPGGTNSGSSLWMAPT